jgi:hypothetical protein
MRVQLLPGTLKWIKVYPMLTADGARELAYKEPWLYHVVWKSDLRARETIASDGLAPGRMRHHWHPLFKPRPAHVYLATRRYLERAAWWMRSGSIDDLYAVSTKFLVPGRINPDEDHFSGDGITACDNLGLHRPPDMDLWRVFGSSLVPSYGTWADQVGLGSDPNHVIYSVRQGSLAYNGVVPPKALMRWDNTTTKWNLGSDPNG